MAKDPKNRKNFFKSFKAELKKVIWPTPKQIVKNTLAVITIVLIAAVIVFILDLILDFFNKQGIDGLKSRIQVEQSTNIVIDELDDNIIQLDTSETEDNIIQPETNEIDDNTATNQDEIAEE